GAHAPSPGTPGSIWVGFAESRILAPARDYLRRMLAIGLLFLVIAAALARFITARITTQLASFTAAAEAIADDDYSPRVRSDRRDELGRLADSLNVMADRIRDSQGRLEQQVVERTEALDALQESEARRHGAEAQMRQAQ